jgi:L-fuculose-phosphate aldolase
MDSFRDKIAETCHYIYNLGMVPGKSGNISVRTKNIMGITPSGFSLKDVEGEDIVLLDLNSNEVLMGKTPSSEFPLHTSIYSKRKDIFSIVHTHSPYASGFALARTKIKWLEGFGPIKSEYLPQIEYAPPGSNKLADLVSNRVKKDDIVILEGHGIVCVGKNLDEAVLMSEWIESVAKTIFISETLKK